MIFYPSMVEQTIIGVLDNWQEGIDTYTESALTIIETELNKTDIEWSIEKVWLDPDKGVCVISWVENSHLHTMSFDFVVD